MSLSVAIAVIVVFDVALVGLLTWMMSHPRRLTAHVSGHAVTAAPVEVQPAALYERLAA
jgi:hypothetical protein